MVGLLRIKGSIDLEQFWPDGSSDADTSKVIVDVAKDGFSYAADGKKFKATRVFNNAFVKGAKKAPLINAKRQITVRLQGVDAPELHYRAAALKSSSAISDKKRAAFNEANRPNRRQYWAETATVALAKKLQAFGKQSIKCEVYSYVDQPRELPDTYGRVVGNICVGKGFKTDINLWLVSEGWAFPTFYSSMSNDEIEAFLKAHAKGKTKKRTLRSYSHKLNKFDAKLLFRGEGVDIEAAADKGDVIMPKLYRRQVAYQMQRKAKVFSGTFRDYLEANADRCFRTSEFLKEGVHTAASVMLHDFVKGATFGLQPHEVVFKEKFSTLVDSKGKEIVKF